MTLLADTVSVTASTETRPTNTAPTNAAPINTGSVGTAAEAPRGAAAMPPDAIRAAIRAIRQPVRVVRDPSTSALGATPAGSAAASEAPPAEESGLETIGTLPPQYPEWLGDRSFGETHGTRFAYVAGEMAHGIATTALVTAAARAGMLAFFGAGGLPAARVQGAVDELAAALPGQRCWGVNLIHSPMAPRAEEEIAELLVRSAVPIVSASAYLDLTPAVVRCAVAGLRLDRSGAVVRPTRLFAKVSNTRVAEKFLSPAPRALLDLLVERGQLTVGEADLAARVPLAEDVTVEADSGGHTDGRPLVAHLPAILELRDRCAARYSYRCPIRVGAAGGLGTPVAIAAAFALGAAYVVTGSVNQASVEAGLSPEAKALLAEADMADVAMAPSPDMFELGAKVQVLSRGTMFAARANRLREVYQAHASLDEIPGPVRATLEQRTLGATLDEVWTQTRAYWSRRDPAELERADRDPKHRMALLFRWYLGRSSGWAVEGEPSRRADYQIWCGPAMGAFNRWAAGSFLAEPENRTVAQIGLNLLEGAAVVTRAHQLRTYGVPVPDDAFAVRPRRFA
jgi:trans-AT polyketide synthase, acyltransferase and oxidoreductase domains